MLIKIREGIEKGEIASKEAFSNCFLGTTKECILIH